MYLHEIVNPAYVPLRATNTIADGLDAMHEQDVDTVALIDFTTGHLLGTAHLADIETEKDRSQTLFSKVRKKPFTLKASLHIADAIHEMATQSKDFAVVMDAENMFSGLVFRADAERALAGLFNADKEGAVIMIEVTPNDYSLIDLVRLTEQESIKILSLGVDAPEIVGQRFRISMKVNTTDIGNLLRALNRYGYVITSKTEDEETDEDLHDRADEFMRFLNI